jgi:hypothetical protein
MTEKTPFTSVFRFPKRVTGDPSPPVLYGLLPFGRQKIFLMREGLQSYIRLRGGTSCVPSVDGCRAAVLNMPTACGCSR